ncbi:MAG: glycosyltransferase family 2 protein, partial [Blautia sp.]|nr:glycosyltransferase family 2 protein [Blautia sp.]
MTIEVIIPAWKPGKELEELISRLMRQRVRPDRIHIVNTDKKYWDPGLCDRWPQIEVTHIEKMEFDHGGTRDKAARESLAQVFVFMTQDALPADEHLLERLTEPFEADDKVGAVYARQLPRPDCRRIERFYRNFNYPDKSTVRSQEDAAVFGIRTYFCSNVCAAYRADIYRKTGGFPSHAIFNEDMVCVGQMLQQGYKVAYAAGARVIHSHNYTCAQQFRRNFDLGVSQTDFPGIFGGFVSEGEGLAMVRNNAGHLIREGHPFEVGYLILQSAAKYAGYRLGKHYRTLPGSVIRRCTM